LQTQAEVVVHKDQFVQFLVAQSVAQFGVDVCKGAPVPFTSTRGCTPRQQASGHPLQHWCISPNVAHQAAGEVLWSMAIRLAMSLENSPCFVLNVSNSCNAIAAELVFNVFSRPLRITAITVCDVPKLYCT